MYNFFYSLTALTRMGKKSKLIDLWSFHQPYNCSKISIAIGNIRCLLRGFEIECRREKKSYDLIVHSKRMKTSDKFFLIFVISKVHDKYNVKTLSTAPCSITANSATKVTHWCNKRWRSTALLKSKIKTWPSWWIELFINKKWCTSWAPTKYMIFQWSISTACNVHQNQL